MEIVIKGGMYNRRKDTTQKVFQFNGEGINFFKDFDPRAISNDSKKNIREYTYLIRTSEEGFDYGVHFLNEKYGPRKPAVVVFIRAGWMVPNNGGALERILRRFAQKTLNAIGKHVEGYDSDVPLETFQNPLIDENFYDIIRECDFKEIDKIHVKEELSDKRIFLTGDLSVSEFFENPYQKEQISMKCVVLSANETNSESFPNDIVKRANISRNYLYKSLDSALYSLKLSRSEVSVRYPDPLGKKDYTDAAMLSGSESRYLKYTDNRFVYQKTDKEAKVPFRYEIKINCRIKGAGNVSRKNVYPHQTADGILTVDYNDLPLTINLTCPDAEPEDVTITQADIMKGYKEVDFRAIEEEFKIHVAGDDFDTTTITVKVDSTSPAYKTLRELSRRNKTVDLSKAIKSPQDNKKSVVRYLSFFVVVALIALLSWLLLFKKADKPNQDVPAQSFVEFNKAAADNIEEDKKYFNEESIWKMADLKSDKARQFYKDVLNWDVDKIKNNKDFEKCANNEKLNRAVSNGDDPDKKASIKDELMKNRSAINLDELCDFIEREKNSNASSDADNAQVENTGNQSNSNQ